MPTSGVVAAAVAVTACYPAGVMAAWLPLLPSFLFSSISHSFALSFPVTFTGHHSQILSHYLNFSLSVFYCLPPPSPLASPPLPIPSLSPSSSSRLGRWAVRRADPDETNDKVGSELVRRGYTRRLKWKPFFFFRVIFFISPPLWTLISHTHSVERVLNLTHSTHLQSSSAALNCRFGMIIWQKVHSIGASSWLGNCAPKVRVHALFSGVQL